MINWFNVFANMLWILGLSVLLTTLSLSHWFSNQQAQFLRQGLAKPPARLATAAGFMLFALGLTLSVNPWWHKIGWIVIFALSSWEGVVAWQDWFGKTRRS